MRKRNSIAHATLFALLSLPALAHAADSPTAADCWKAGMLAGDATAIAQCYAPNAVFWLPGGPMVKGREAIRQGYAQLLSGVTVKSVELTQMDSVKLGDAAANWGTFKIVLVSRETGAESVEAGRYSDVTRKINGHWQYVMDHPSDDPPANAPAEASPAAEAADADAADADAVDAQASDADASDANSADTDSAAAAATGQPAK